MEKVGRQLEVAHLVRVADGADASMARIPGVPATGYWQKQARLDKLTGAIPATAK